MARITLLHKSTLSALILLSTLTRVSGSVVPWPERLWLGRGGFWMQRVGFTVTNPGEVEMKGFPVTLKVGTGDGELPLQGVRMEELRLVDARGVELLFGIRASGSNVRMTSGTIPKDARISIPCCCGAKGKVSYYFYFDNPAAWGLAYGFDDKEASAKGVRPQVAVGAVERLKVVRTGETEAWPSDREWECRVPIRIGNFSDNGFDSSLAMFRIGDALRGIRNPEWAVYVDGRKVTSCKLGDNVLFPCPVPTWTIRTCWLYAKSGVSKNSVMATEEVSSALGSVIPSDQVLVAQLNPEDRKSYEELLRSSANLVKNPCFDEGEGGWTHSEENRESGVVFEIVKGGGFFGERFAKMAVPVQSAGKWRGWHQTVPVAPGRHYFYGGFISGDDISYHTSIAAHVIGRNGKTTTMVSGSELMSGPCQWSPSFGIVTAGREDAKLSLHLTTRGSGSYAYDGLLVAPCLQTEVGDTERRLLQTADSQGIAVQRIEPIVKVFRETPVADSHGIFEVALARNEVEPLQLAVRAPRGIGKLEVEVSSPTNGSGTGGVSAEVGIVGYVPVDAATAYYHSAALEWELKHPNREASSDGWAGWWPDPIMPTNACAVTADATQPIWITFRTAPDACPGSYRGNLIWKADGKVIRTDAYVVKVWNFILPETAELPAVYDLRVDGRWAPTMGVKNADERRRAFWKFYSEKRICPNSIGVNIEFKRNADGTITADFSEYDRVAGEYFNEFKFPVSYTPNLFYCFGWGLPPRNVLGEEPFNGKRPFGNVDRTKLRAEYKRVYQDMLRLYWNHVKTKGWNDRFVLYISDEPHFHVKAIRDQMVALCRMIHEVDPTIRIYSSTWRHCPEWNDSLDVWGVSHYGSFPVGEMKARADAGKHIWFTTDGQMCLDTPYCAVERLLPHYCKRYHAEAYEFWGATWLTHDPWKFGWHKYISQTDIPGRSYHIRYPNGDGYLIYPGVCGKFKGPVTSVRLEAVRDGVEDFSYLKALERLSESGDGQRAIRAKTLLGEFSALVRIPNAGGRYSSRVLPEPERLGELRLRAGELLDERIVRNVE